MLTGKESATDTVCVGEKDWVLGKENKLKLLGATACPEFIFVFQN